MTRVRETLFPDSQPRGWFDRHIRPAWTAFFELVSPLVWLAVALCLAALVAWLWITLQAERITLQAERRQTSEALLAVREARGLADLERAVTQTRTETVALREVLRGARESLDDSRQSQRELAEAVRKELLLARTAFQQRVLPDTALQPVVNAAVNVPINANTHAVQALEHRLEALEAAVRQRLRPQRLAVVVGNSTRLKASALNQLVQELHSRARLAPGLTLSWFEYRGRLTRVEPAAQGEPPSFPDPGPQAGTPSLKDLVPQKLFTGPEDGALRRALLVVTAESEPPEAAEAWRKMTTDVVLVRFRDRAANDKELVAAESRWRELAARDGGVLALVEVGQDSAAWPRQVADAVRRLAFSASP